MTPDYTTQLTPRGNVGKKKFDGQNSKKVPKKFADFK